MSKPEEFIRAYEKALESQTWEKVAPLIHDDCVATFTEGTFQGKSEVEGAFRKTFALIKDEKYWLSDIHWVQKTDRFAVFTYIFNWAGIINGSPSSGSGRGTSIIINGNGNWLLLSEHLGPLARN